MADCTYSVPNLDTSGDTLYGSRICDQPFIDWAWEVHGFNGTYWQGGWGFDDVCNIRKPLARCLNAMCLLNYSMPDPNDEPWSGNALQWGGRYVREQKVITLEDAIRKMTSENAIKIHLYDRGLLRPGMAADVTVFDPAKIIDNATYEKPWQYATGVQYVLVNGALVLDHGEHTHAHPGKVLYGPGRRG